MTDNIDVGQLSEAINDKMDRDANNAEDALRADYVIDYQAPTAENNYTWYRLYKSGWVEQGGVFTKTSNPTSVSLIKTMADTNYSITLTPTFDADSLYEKTIYCGDKTISSFDTKAGSYSSNGANTVRNVCSWEAKGMSAQS